MIVFWRLFLAYYIADFALYGKRFYCYGECHPWKLALARGILFWAAAMVLGGFAPHDGVLYIFGRLVQNKRYAQIPQHAVFCLARYIQLFGAFVVRAVPCLV